MAVKKRKLGKVTKQVGGYLIRPIGSFKVVREGFSPLFQPNGTFGVYATKRLLKDGFKTVDEAVAYAEKL